LVNHGYGIQSMSARGKTIIILGLCYLEKPYNLNMLMVIF